MIQFYVRAVCLVQNGYFYDALQQESSCVWNNFAQWDNNLQMSAAWL